jgi:hypothetical protein
MHAFDILLECSTGLAESDVRVHHSDAHDRQVLPAHEPSIKSTWQARLDGNPNLFNGTKFRFHGVCADANADADADAGGANADAIAGANAAGGAAARAGDAVAGEHRLPELLRHQPFCSLEGARAFPNSSFGQPTGERYGGGDCRPTGASAAMPTAQLRSLLHEGTVALLAMCCTQRRFSLVLFQHSSRPRRPRHASPPAFCP